LLGSVGQGILSVPWFSSINLLAGRRVVPEYSFRGEGPLEEVGATLASWLQDSAAREAAIEGLDAALERLGPPGAARRAAAHAIGLCLGDAEIATPGHA